MAAPLIPIDASLDDLLDETSFTQGKLQSSPLSSPLTPQYDTFQGTWATTNSARIALVVALAKARGAASAADDVIDDFIDALDHALLAALKNNRKAPAYLVYFGDEAPSRIKRPILGKELETVTKWIPSLQASPYATVAALAPTLVTGVATANAAAAAVKAAEQALVDFDATGGKAQLIAGANALRQTTYGDLAALPHQNPTANLPATFADRFFQHEGRTGLAAIKTVAEANDHVARAQKKLTALQNHAANLTAEETARAAAKTAAATAEAAAATAKKTADAAKKAAKEAEEALKAAKAKAKKRK